MIETPKTPLQEVVANAPTPEAVRRLERWLRLNPSAWVRLYHGTDARLPVLTEGLLPTSRHRRNSLQSRTGYVSFSLFPGHAEWFGRLAHPQRPVTVYGVDLRVGELAPDLDQLRNQRQWAGLAMADTLAHSLAYGHGAQVKGSVSGARLFIAHAAPVQRSSFAPVEAARIKIA
jgi:hypothetical protein